MLNVLASTTKTQKQRMNDFCFVPEDELVTFGFVCDGEEDPDSECGCSRSMTGVECRKGTTTVKVIQTNMSKEEYLDRLWEGEKKVWGLSDTDVNEAGEFIEFTNELLRIAKSFPVDSVLEYRGGYFNRRS